MPHYNFILLEVQCLALLVVYLVTRVSDINSLCSDQADCFFCVVYCDTAAAAGQASLW
jgi:hypothetical protein